MKINREELLRTLEEVRALEGEEAYYKARHALALMLVGTDAGKTFLAETFADLDVEAVYREAVSSKTATDQDLFNLMRLQVPNLKTQSQFDAYRLAFEALSYMADAYFSGNETLAERSRVALENAITAIQEASKLVERAQAIPEEDRGQAVANALRPPREFTEVEEQRRLLAELDAVTDLTSLNQWYHDSRSRMELVVSQPYRNQLFDAIREKQQKLSN